MAVSCQVIRFTKDSTGVAGATQDVNLTFTPKAIIVFHPAIVAASDDTFQQVFAGSYGFSDGTNHACVSWRSLDNQATSVTGGSHRADAVVAMQNTVTPDNVNCRATVAFATNKLTFTWTVNDVNPLLIVVVAFGGTDITNAKVNTVDIGDTATGVHSYTGLGFNPTGNGKSILFTLDNNTTATNANSAICSPSLGCAVSSTKRWTYANTLEDARTVADTWRYFSPSRCLASLVDTTGAVDYVADFNAWITDGFQLDVEDASASATNKFSYMVIEGGQWDVGDTTTNAGTGDQIVPTDAVFSTIRGVFNLYLFGSTIDTAIANAAYGIGASDGTTQACMSLSERDALDPSQNISRSTSAATLYGVITGAASPFTPAETAKASLTSFGTNAYTINHSVAVGAANVFFWWAVGEAAAAAAVEDIFPHSFGTIQAFDNNIGPAIFGAGSEIGT